MKPFLWTAALALALAPESMEAQTRLLRHPSWHDNKVAFSYFGDIWVANGDGSSPRRITDNRARDIYPRFSPDGKWIAFSSDRDGNNDVYVVPAEGGKPKQLTFHTAADTVLGWTPDSKNILFSSARGNGAFPNVATLWQISVEGGMESPLAVDWGSGGSYASDGTKLAFTRHPAVWSRQHYRGSYNADLWVMDVSLPGSSPKKFTKLDDSDYKGNHLWPMYGQKGEIYFVADRLPVEKGLKYAGPEVMKSVNNIWKISDKGGVPVQVTHHTSGNLYFPTISADGRTIVYEENFGIWKLDTATGKSTEIRVDVRSDAKDNDTRLRTFRNEAEEFDLSPSNKRAVVSVHGELFTVATAKGDVQRVTETFWREKDPTWSPDGKLIAFVSDRTGRQEIWVSGELGKDPVKVSDADCDKSSLVWAADSKSLLWTGSDHKLRRVEIPSGKTDIVASSDVGQVTGPQFSPDGKWISYAKQDALTRAHVFLKNLDTGAETQINSEEFTISNGAKWTPDGKKLLLLGGTGTNSMAALGRTTFQAYAVSLVPVEKGPDEGVDTELEAVQADAAPARRAGAGGGKVEVKIEWAGLTQRIKLIASVPGSVNAILPAPDSRTYAMTAFGDGAGGPAIYTVNEDGTRLNRLSTTPAPDATGAPQGRGGGGFGGASEPKWAKDSRSLYYLQGRSLYSIPVSVGGGDATAAAPAGGGGRGGRGGGLAVAAAATAPAAGGAAPKRVDYTLHMEVNTEDERRQVFEEAWRTMKYRFYDAKMHGVNWNLAKDKYESLMPHVSGLDDLHDVVMEMIGELNASHTGISGGSEGDAPREAVVTRFPGFDLEPDASGFYKVSSVYRKGPADHEYLKLAKGNFITAVNGKELRTTDNYWRMFNLLPGSKFEFMVNSKPSADGAWKVGIDPVSSTAQADLEYERWVANRKASVSALSGGKIGYLHIRAMDAPSLARFQRELTENLDKKALVIDQRFNGGGGIDQELLAILVQRKPYESYQGRDSVVLNRPTAAFFGPMAVLQNERSASDAEMFPEGFRALGLGKVIGVNTMGAVIGTGAFTLLDGSALRTPGFGVFGARGQNLENYGVPPDVEIDNTPTDFLAGHDRQVEKAVEVLSAQIK